MIGFGSKNIYQRDMCLKEIGIACSRYDYHMSLCDWGNLHDHTTSTQIATWIMNKIFIGALKNPKDSGDGGDLDWLTILY